MILYIQHNYDDMVKWYKELAEKNKDLVIFYDNIHQSSKTHEGRNIPAVHITDDVKDEKKGNSLKKKVYFQCLIHASEF